MSIEIPSNGGQVLWTSQHREALLQLRRDNIDTPMLGLMIKWNNTKRYPKVNSQRHMSELLRKFIDQNADPKPWSQSEKDRLERLRISNPSISWLRIAEIFERDRPVDQPVRDLAALPRRYGQFSSYDSRQKAAQANLDAMEVTERNKSSIRSGLPGTAEGTGLLTPSPSTSATATHSRVDLSEVESTKRLWQAVRSKDPTFRTKFEEYSRCSQPGTAERALHEIRYGTAPKPNPASIDDMRYFVPRASCGLSESKVSQLLASTEPTVFANDFMPGKCVRRVPSGVDPRKFFNLDQTPLQGNPYHVVRRSELNNREETLRDDDTELHSRPELLVEGLGEAYTDSQSTHFAEQEVDWQGPARDHENRQNSSTSFPDPDEPMQTIENGVQVTVDPLLRNGLTGKLDWPPSSLLDFGSSDEEGDTSMKNA